MSAAETVSSDAGDSPGTSDTAGKVGGGAAAPLQRPAKMIICVLPNDGTHVAVVEKLFAEGKTNQVFSHSCLGMDIFADAKVSPGTLPDAFLARMVRVIVAPEEADAMFEQLHEIARINRPGGGAIVLTDVTTATAFTLPDAPPVEEAEEAADGAADKDGGG